MERPIIITNIDGLLIDHAAFTEPHKYWFKRAIKKTKDASLKKWIGREDYFIGVNNAMDKILPNASKEEKTSQARKWYQEDVIKYISVHPEVVKKDIAEKLFSIKERYKIILLTTNTKDYVYNILKVSKLENIYNEIIASNTEEEPNKEILLNELIKKYGKPRYYLTGKPDDKINNLIKKLNITIIDINKLNSL